MITYIVAVVVYILIGLLVGHLLTKFFRIEYDFGFMFWSAVVWPLVVMAAIVGFGADFLNKIL